MILTLGKLKMIMNNALIQEFNERFGFQLPNDTNLFFLEGYCRVVHAHDLADNIAVANEQKLTEKQN